MENLNSKSESFLNPEEALVGWRILSAVEEISPGRYAKTQARSWKSDYAQEFLMLEMRAQTGGVIVGAVRDFTGNVVFAKVERAEFSGGTVSKSAGLEGNPALLETVPLVIEAFARDGVSEQGSWIDAHVLRGSDKIATARLFLIDAGDLLGAGKSVTFHAEFLDYYKVREKILRL